MHDDHHAPFHTNRLDHRRRVRSVLPRGATTFAIGSVRNDGAKSDRQKPVRVSRDEDLRAVLVPALTRAIIDLVGE